MANSVDPDQTAPTGAVWSGSSLFAQTSLCPSYLDFFIVHKSWSTVIAKDNSYC